MNDVRSAKQPHAEPAPSTGVEALTDAALVARAREGERWAHGAIFRRHASAVLGMATRVLGRADEADDVVQEAFFAAFRNLDRLDDPSRLRPWLMGIAIHRARRKLRARSVLRVLGLASDPGFSELVSSSASPEQRTELTLVGRLVADLPVDERVAWTLRHLGGEQLDAIAKLTDCSLATVKRRIAAAEERLRSAAERGGR